MTMHPFAGPEAGSALAARELLRLLEARTGQHMAPGRNWRLGQALAAIMRDTGHDTLEQLALAVRSDRAGSLADRVVDELLNQETSFFRDSQVFEAIDAAIGAVPASRRPRIWSAGCSTGQEPLSLAMMFAERADRTMPDIVATDVSERAIERARAGRYTQFEVQRGLPVRRMIEWFKPAGGDWTANPVLTRMIAFRRLNLVADPLPGGRFDVVMCRNVLLYFSAEVRRRVLERLADAMRPDGLLVLGAGETVIGQTDAFRPSTRFRGLYEPNR